MKYENFWMRIEPSSGDSYSVSVQSPQGEGRETLRLVDMGQRLCAGRMPNREQEGRQMVTFLPSIEMPALEIGKDLFRALFRGEVANLFHSSVGGLRGRLEGLRINIAIDPRRPELAPFQKLPWELLCRPETEDVLCLSRRTPVVRSLDAHRERRPAIARPKRLRILVVAANPSDRPALAVARERANLLEAWKGQEKDVEFVFLQRGGAEEIREAFLAAPFHALHFMGHGGFDEERSEGVLLLEQSDGSGQPFEGRRLAQMLRDFESLRLVVLNACHTAEAVGTHGPNPFTGAASSLVMGGVPAVVAMSGPVSDLAAVAFSRTFYQRLAAGDPIEAAVTEGRLAIQRAEPGEGAWATPALFLRSPDGSLFAPRSTIWARRAALLAGAALTLSLLGVFTAAWVREHRRVEAMRRANDGIGLLELGRKEEARKAFRSALEYDPNNGATLADLAVVEMQLGEDEVALEHAQAAVRAEPKEAVYRYNLGNLLARKKRYEEALPQLRRAIEINPRYSYAYNELGNIYLELDHLQQARKAFDAGLACDPTLASLHKNLARAALAEGHPDEAVLHLEKALPLYSPADLQGETEALYWLASADAIAGKRTMACVALRKFEALDPNLLSAFAQVARGLALKQGCALWPR